MLFNLKVQETVNPSYEVDSNSLCKNHMDSMLWFTVKYHIAKSDLTKITLEISVNLISCTVKKPENIWVTAC